MRIKPPFVIIICMKFMTSQRRKIEFLFPRKFVLLGLWLSSLFAVEWLQNFRCSMTINWRIVVNAFMISCRDAREINVTHQHVHAMLRFLSMNIPVNMAVSRRYRIWGNLYSRVGVLSVRYRDNIVPVLSRLYRIRRFVHVMSRYRADTGTIRNDRYVFVLSSCRR